MKSRSAKLLFTAYAGTQQLLLLRETKDSSLIGEVNQRLAWMVPNIARFKAEADAARGFKGSIASVLNSNASELAQPRSVNGQQPALVITS